MGTNNYSDILRFLNRKKYIHKGFSNIFIFQIVIDVSDFVDNLSVKVVERELVIQGENKKTTKTFTRRFSLPEDVNPEDITAVMSPERILIITIIRRIVKVTQVKKDATKKDDTEKTTTTKTTKTVTITTKGPFFNDPTFVEDVKNFEQAITTVIKKFNLKITEKDAYTTYRTYRKSNPKNENQAVSEKETDKTKKVSLSIFHVIFQNKYFLRNFE